MDERVSRLSPAGGASCGPVAVGAVTGKSRADVESAIRQAAREDGDQDAGDLSKTSFRHQARAVELLGFELFSDGNRIDARSITPESGISVSVLSKEATSAQFLRDNHSKDVILCYARRLRNGQPEAHTFAVDNDCYYDNHTGGKVTTSVPAEVADFHVGRHYAVRKRSA